MSEAQLSCARRRLPAQLLELLGLLSLLPHASGLSSAAVLSLRPPSAELCRLSRAVEATTSSEPAADAVEAKASSEPAANTLRFSGLRRIYSEYAARCDEDACLIEGPINRFATRPVRWVRALFP
eukprot:CAMPEP_0119082488 /NCGR_PEP_ID=MMETSP1178-20130426/121439_1 /TAXON_ID=33656 /ORGANISM="unid sp, Strain CCMP2000" /LENGTH=124 /DNA_ID=CAMNT_0007065259 /DNA_START=16 /DNA_END=386 /DNA_ORIENTATION=+